MYAYKDVLELAGLTTRLYTLLSTLHNIPPLPPFAPSSSESTIAFDNLDVGVPHESDDLAFVKGLDYEMKAGAGEHLLITGSNGVGKTSVARVIAGLWAPKSGTVARPKDGVSEVFVVPQRSYMVYGSLLDQYVSAFLS